MEKLLSKLNPAQREAAVYTEGPQLIVAGAGSGKTRTLTYKIAYLLKLGYKPRRILALTFTNKAAEEMRSRIDSLLGDNYSRHLWMGTFHSIFGKMLRIDAEKIGFTANYTIYDSSDSASMIKSIIKEFKLDNEKYNYKNIQSRISNAKNKLITAEAYAANQDYITEDTKEGRGEFFKIYLEYAKRCKQANVMDFDDLLLYTNILFKISKDSLEKFRGMFDYILVDEYQDTNFAQYLIVKKLSEIHRKLCVVGDDAQSIYSFRGARIQNILNFKNDYPDYKLFKLEQNYRSTKNIVEAANSLIAKNLNQISKILFSENESGSLIKVRRSLDDNQEGYDIGMAIREYCNKENFEFSDFAVLYRTNAQSRIFEDAFRALNIPHKVYGALSFYQRKEIKDVFAYLKLIINHNDPESFKRIINYPARRIGSTTVEKIFEFASKNNVSIWEVVSKINDLYEIKISNETRRHITGFVTFINDMANKLHLIDAYDFIVELVNRSGINNDLLADKTQEGISRYENLQELLNSVKNFVEKRKKSDQASSISAEDYLQDIVLYSDLEEDDDDENESKNVVSLMTVHAAKGLEFKNVFIVGAESELFPSGLSKFSMEEFEEERRLFYVAMTRAMKNLIISYADKRFRFGRIIYMAPSDFLYDIDNQYLDWPDKYDEDEPDTDFERELNNFYSNNIDFVNNKLVIQNQSEKKGPPKIKNPKPENLVSISKIDKILGGNESVNTDIYAEGMLVLHEKFGQGVITKINVIDRKKRADILFDDYGIKTLLLEYAKLQII